MKKWLYKSLLIVTSLFAMTSCSDFLDEENKVGQTADITYSTKSGIDGLVSSCYSYLRMWYGKEAAIGLSEMGTDLFYYGYDNHQKSLLSYNITSESLDGAYYNNPCLDHYWESFFTAVDLCNLAMEYIPSNVAITDKLKNEYMGEVLFLRAFYYWHMVNIWGAVPYKLESVKSAETDEHRDSEEIVYSNILNDLDEAAKYLETQKGKSNGRVTYWTVRAFKARVLLYAASWLEEQKQIKISTNKNYAGKNLYELALSEANDVINSNVASFYENHFDTWSMKNENIGSNKETIWGVVYGSNLTRNVLPTRLKTNIAGKNLGWNGLILVSPADIGGSFMHLMYAPKWNNTGTDLSDVFLRATDPGASITHRLTGKEVNVADAYSRYSRGYTRHIPTIYLMDLFYKFKDTDQRYAVTIRDYYTIAPGLEGSSKFYQNMKDTAVYLLWEDANTPKAIAAASYAKHRYRLHTKCNGALPLYTSDNPATALPTQVKPDQSLNPYRGESNNVVSETQYNNIYNSDDYAGDRMSIALRKFESDDPSRSTNDKITPIAIDRDVPVLRLAEMYLIKAEAQLANGNSKEALVTINELRKIRAVSGKDNTIPGPCTLETILDERAIELTGEQQRWFDLKRTGTLIERVNRYNAQSSANIQPFHLLRPIPQDQMDAVTNKSDIEGVGFWQNPGY